MKRKNTNSLTHSVEFTSETLNQDWKWHKYTHERILTRATVGHIRPFLFIFRYKSSVSLHFFSSTEAEERAEICYVFPMVRLALCLDAFVLCSSCLSLCSWWCIHVDHGYTVREQRHEKERNQHSSCTWYASNGKNKRIVNCCKFYDCNLEIEELQSVCKCAFFNVSWIIDEWDMQCDCTWLFLFVSLALFRSFAPQIRLFCWLLLFFAVHRSCKNTSAIVPPWCWKLKKKSNSNPLLRTHSLFTLDYANC